MVPSLPLSAQEAGVTASLSADSVTMAEVFELRVRVDVPPGRAVYFPDSLPSSAVLESYGPAEWRARRGPDGGASLTISYPLIPFGEGLVPVPGLEVLAVPIAQRADGDTERQEVPGGSVVGLWSDAPAALGYTTRIPESAVWVAYVHSLDEIVQGVSPRPPEDVAGFSWSWPSLALLLLFSSVIGGAVVTTTKDWLASRPPPPGPPAPPPPTLEQARMQALGELDRLLQAGPHPAERAHDLYSESSGIVRGFVERLEPDWGPDLTSTELMRRLDDAARAGPELMSEMRAAEAVKFGRVRPASPRSETHLRRLRAWVADGDGAES